MAERASVLVCDTGSGSIKCGFAGDSFPRELPCVIGRPVVGRADVDAAACATRAKDVYVGDECGALRCALQCSHPVADGAVRDWDGATLLWGRAFRSVLGAEPRDCRLLLTESPLAPAAQRARALEVMLETFGFGGVAVQAQAVLSLYSQGLLTGLVVDAGDGATHAVPVVEGYALPHLTRSLRVGGRHVSAYLADLLGRRGYALDAAGADAGAVRAAKERLCYLAYDFAQEVKLARETTCGVETYALPDGRVIRLGPERFTAPEALFDPGLIGLEGGGLAEMVHGCVQAADIDVRQPLYSHVVLSGGSTMFPGFAGRLHRELRSLYLDRVLRGDLAGLKRLKLAVQDPPRRRHMVFLGGAVLADIMRDQEAFWVTKEQWAEDPHRALAKCGATGG